MPDRQLTNNAADIFRPLIDLLFRPFEREHCYRAYLAEQRGHQLPKEYRL